MPHDVPHTVAEIAEALGLPFEGRGDLCVTGAAEPAEAGPDRLAIAMTPAYTAKIGAGGARAALLWAGADWRGLGLAAAILPGRPRYALAGITARFDPGPGIAPGIHPTACLDASATVGEGAAIGPFAVIGPGARIGARARIGAHVSVGADTRIGADALLMDGVRIAARVVIGAHFIAQPGAVVGGDGFSFVTPDRSAVEEVRETLGARGEVRRQAWARIHSLGGVEIGDDVEIGANTTIDRGTLRATVIGRGCKIDNLCQIAHNVTLGEDVLMSAQCGIAGSSRLGDRVVLGGKSGVSDNVSVGNDVVAGGASMIFTNVPAGRVVLGSPAIKMPAQIEATKNIRRLPRLFKAVAELQKAVQTARQGD